MEVPTLEHAATSQIHLIGGEKGGVGKSMVSRLLAQYFIDHQIWTGANRMAKANGMNKTALTMTAASTSATLSNCRSVTNLLALPSLWTMSSNQTTGKPSSDAQRANCASFPDMT